jgi:hypothetical protein
LKEVKIGGDLSYRWYEMALEDIVREPALTNSLLTSDRDSLIGLEPGVVDTRVEVSVLHSNARAVGKAGRDPEACTRKDMGAEQVKCGLRPRSGLAQKEGV